MFPEGRILDFVIVGVVALIVVGPKDLPMLMRKVGQFVARMRAMAAEFRASFDEMARQSELDELRREVEAMRAGKPYEAAAGLGEDGEVSQVFDDIHTSLRNSEIQMHPPMSYQVSTPDAETAESKTAAAAPADALSHDAPTGQPPIEALPEESTAPLADPTIAKAAS